MPSASILLIDDDRSIRKVVERTLRGEPYELFHVTNGRLGLEFLEKQQPDLIILDLMMPEMNGIEFLRAIAITPETPYAVIILTGHGDDEEMRQCYKLGAHFFLKKPFGMTEFLCIVKRSLTLKQLERESRQYRNYLEASVEKQNAYISKLSLTLDQSGSSILITDLQGCITYINKAFVDNTGYEFREILGKTADQVNSVFNHDFFQMVLESIAVSDSWKGELINSRKDGSTYMTSTSIVPVKDHLGEISNLIIVQDDITMKKEAEREKSRAERYVEENKFLQSNFCNNISHELLTPLHVISTAASLLANMEMTGEQEKYLSFIQQSAADLQNLINRILNLVVADTARHQVRQTTYSIEEIFAALEAIHRPDAALKGLEFRCEIPADLPRRCIGDELRLRQILSYLLNNAVKFTNSGHIKLSARLDRNSEGEIIIYQVEDTGIGIPADKQEIIFDPFQQGDGSNSRSYNGLGIGLTLVQSLVASLNGEIEVDSEVNRGSTFSVALPFAGTAE